MDDYNLRIFNCVERVHFFKDEPALAPLTPKETELFGSVTAAWNGLKAYSADQTTGNHGFREGALERRLAVNSMVAMNRRIADIAKSIAEEGVDPGMAEQFRLPRNRTHLVVAITADAFADEADPVKALFIERGMEATFVTDLRALVTAFETASGVRVGGLAVQTTGTAGVAQLARSGLKSVRLLRPLIREKLKTNLPLQAAWDLAARVARRGTEEAPATPPAPPEGSGSGI